MRTSTAIAAVLLAGIAWSGAMAVEKPPQGSTPVPQGPFYDSRTGSYFEMQVSKGIRQPNWNNIRVLAARQSYKGRQGRLAVVRDLETLNFLRETFRFNGETWIGLRFFCKFRKLIWVTGEIQPLNTPGVWAPQWYRNADVRCTNDPIDYMSVYLTEEADAGGVFWQAVGQAKYFRAYMVEYPAPPSAASGPDPEGKGASGN